jgi:hypothetical protein
MADQCVSDPVSLGSGSNKVSGFGSGLDNGHRKRGKKNNFLHKKLLVWIQNRTQQRSGTGTGFSKMPEPASGFGESGSVSIEFFLLKYDYESTSKPKIFNNIFSLFYEYLIPN